MSHFLLNLHEDNFCNLRNFLRSVQETLLALEKFKFIENLFLKRRFKKIAFPKFFFHRRELIDKQIFSTILKKAKNILINRKKSFLINKLTFLHTTLSKKKKVFSSFLQSNICHYFVSQPRFCCENISQYLNIFRFYF